MAAPSPDLIVTNPPPLQTQTDWPYEILPFPATDLLASNYPPTVAYPPAALGK